MVRDHREIFNSHFGAINIKNIHVEQVDDAQKSPTINFEIVEWLVWLSNAILNNNVLV